MTQRVLVIDDSEIVHAVTEQRLALEALVAAADAALYVAKREGRNRVVVADALPRVSHVPTPAPR